MSAREGGARDWLVVLACLVCQMGMGTGGYVFPVFMRPVGEELGWSRTLYAAANPIMSTCVALAGPLVGWLSDRRGPRLVLVVGSVLMSAGLLGASYMEQVWQFYVVAVVVGIAVACLGDLPTASAIAGRFAARRGVALGLVYIGSNLGGALGAAGAAALAVEAGWRGALATLGGWLWILLLPFALLVGLPRRPLPARRPADAAGETDPPASGAAADLAFATDNDVATALRGRDFWLLAWVLVAFYLYRLGVNAHLVAFLSDLGYAHGEAALGFSVTIAVGILGKLLVGSLADRIGARRAALGNFLAITFASALLLVPELPLAIPLFLLVHGVATAAEDVVVPLVVGQRFGTRYLANIYGWLMLALVPGGILGPIVAGAAFDGTGSYAAVFAAFFLCNASAVLALASVRVAHPA